MTRGEFTFALSERAPSRGARGPRPNGSGKSTLLSAAAGLMPVSRGGRILLDGQVVDDAAKASYRAAQRPSGSCSRTIGCSRT